MTKRFFALLIVVACGGAGASTQPATTGPAASASSARPPASTSASAASVAPPAPSASASAQVAAGEPDAPTVRVLDAGAEPRQPLRYAFTRQHETIRFDMKTTIAMTIGALATPPVTAPTIRMEVEVDPTDVSADGALTATYRATRVDLLADGTLPAAQRKTLADSLHGLIGMTGRFVVTARGITRESTVDVPPTAPQTVIDTMDSLRQSMRQLAPALPEEPVGIGARWEVHSNVRAKAMHLEQTATYTLKARKGDVVDEDVTLVQSAPAQTMHLPGKAANAHVELVSETGTGGGAVRRKLAGVGASSSLQLHTETKMLTIAAGQKQPLDMSLTLEVQTKPLP